MNRSILIVICDFLLLSLLTFSTLDLNKVADERVHRTVQVDLATNVPDAGKDLTTVMRLALDDERRNRNQLVSELGRARESAGERDKQAQTFQQELQAKADAERKLQQERARLQEEEARLQQQFAAAQTNIDTLNQQLHATTSEALLAKQKLEQAEAEARKHAEQNAALQQQVAQLNSSNQLVLNEKMQLASQLQVAKVQNQYASEQVSHMTEEVKTERAEKAQLAEGVKALANKSDELVQEVRDNRALTPNTIFSDFVSNRVDASFDAFRSSAFGSMKHKTTATVLVTDGTNTFALCHVEDTPLALGNPGTEWEALNGTLSHNSAQIDIRSLSFSWPDPRVAWMPVSPSQARVLGCKVYRTSQDPFKFQDAVLVGAREGYYGECKFEIDLTAPQYVKLDHSFLKGLFGKFNPSRGDLVFSKTGELLGVMVNDSYCLMIRNFDSGATFQFGNDVRKQHTATILAQLYAQVTGLPNKLQ